MLSQTKLIIQDYTRDIYIVSLNEDNEVNTFYQTSDFLNTMLIKENLVLTQSSEHTLSVSTFSSESVDDTLSSILDRDPYTAL